jgi:hypothetical protein
MNDQPDLTPAQEQSVRRLLAAARATEPIPTDIGKRLDDVLRGLADERQVSTSADDNVVDLSARRRARVRNVLVAAAAVVAIGVVAPQYLQVGLGSSDDSASESSDMAGGDADSALSSDEARAPAAESAPEETSGQVPQFTIRADSFESDADAAREQFLSGASTQSDSSYRLACLPSASIAADSTQIPVLFDRREALLVLEPVADGAQRASLYVCGESSPRRTALLDPR